MELKIFNNFWKSSIELIMLPRKRNGALTIVRDMYPERIRRFYHSSLIKVITGVRRCGKSVLLRQIADDLAAQGVDESEITIVSLEDYDRRDLLSPDRLNAHLEERAHGSGKSYFLLDEVQRVERFEEVLNSIHAMANIFITGFNSQILSGELASLLGGRTLSFRVMPFCFREYVRFAREEMGDSRGE